MIVCKRCDDVCQSALFYVSEARTMVSDAWNIGFVCLPSFRLMRSPEMADLQPACDGTLTTHTSIRHLFDVSRYGLGSTSYAPHVSGVLYQCSMLLLLFIPKHININFCYGHSKLLAENALASAIRHRNKSIWQINRLTDWLYIYSPRIISFPLSMFNNAITNRWSKIQSTAFSATWKLTRVPPSPSSLLEPHCSRW